MNDRQEAGDSHAGPFIDTSGEIPKVSEVNDFGCHGSSADGGECPKMELSFDSVDEWEEHRNRHHPTSCNYCDNLSSYKRDNSPSSRCVKHMPEPDEVDSPYQWRPCNRDAAVDVPTLSDDHPVAMALGELDDEAYND